MGRREFIAVLALMACLVVAISRSDRDQPRASTHEVEGLKMRVVMESSPVALKDLEILVECEREEPFGVGFEQGRPVAFFTLESDSQIAGYATNRVDEQRYQPPEIRDVDSLRLTLDVESCQMIGQTSSDPLSDFAEVTVCVWVEGDWITRSLFIAPDGTTGFVKTGVPGALPPPPLFLDGCYEALSRPGRDEP